MKSNFIHYLAAATLGLSALMATGCQSDDDPGQTPQGTIPLAIGNVTIAGVETGGHTRAAIEEDGSTGFTGLRKSRFVDGDRLVLTLTKPSAGPASRAGEGSTETVTATLTEGVWTLEPEKVFVTPGTEISAAYTPAIASGQTYPDALTCAACTLEGQKVSFSMLHANAMLDITLSGDINLPEVTPPTVSVSATPTDGSQETLGTAVEEGDASVFHYRAIAAPGTVTSFSILYNGITYVATLPNGLTVEANKRYPIAINVDDMKFTARVGTSTTNWVKGGDINYAPKGYDRTISTAEELARFAYEVNNDQNGVYGARTAKVLQTADIDLSKLQSNPDAYVATAENWVPIGTGASSFQGTYNGNGYTISNMKIAPTHGFETAQGLFGSVSNANLIGIHLRAVNIENKSMACGALCGSSEASVITLCSATGSITSTPDTNDDQTLGGLIGGGEGGAFTRCSVDVDLTAQPADVRLGGFVGYVLNPFIVSCFSTGDIRYGIAHNCGGFVGHASGEPSSTIYCCYANGTASFGISAFIGGGYNNVSITGCYAKMDNAVDFGTNDETYKITYNNCLFYGATTTIPGGVTATTDITIFGRLTSAPNLSNVKTYHWSAADGYTLTELTRSFRASGIWKSNGSTVLPTINIEYEGEIAAK